jgi:A/G-specific adenine glycosylase
MERLVLGLIPEDRPGDFIQAMMDLGATICRPARPRCGDCPLRPDCTAFASGEPEAFPARKLRAARPRKYGIAYWIESDGQVWLVRRPPKGMLGGMAALPGSEWTDAKLPRIVSLGSVRHVFSHFALDLHLIPRAEPEGEGWWQPLDRLDEAGLPTLYKKAASLMTAGRDRLAA